MLRSRATPFDAIAHPVRRRLLQELLEVGERGASITLLAERAEVSRSTASRHLDILRRAELVTCSPDRQSSVHTLQLDRLTPIAEWVWAMTA